jgi:hypothetical protein
MLIGLGTVVASGGVALGTGAFSSVEADRDVDLETAGDADALLQLNITSETLDGGDEETIEFNVDNLNEEAVTKFDDALEIGYAGDEDSATYEIEITDGDADLRNGEGAMSFNGDGDLEVSDSTGELVLDVVFDLETYDESELPDGEIVFTATQRNP